MGGAWLCSIGATMRRLISGLMLCAATTLQAQPTVDLQLIPSGNLQAFPNFAWYVQSYTALSDWNAGAGWYMTRTGQQGAPAASGTIEISLYSASAGAGGSLLGSGTANWTLGSFESSWIEAQWAPVATTVGNTYWIYMRSVSANPTSTYVHLADPYAPGAAWFSNDPDIMEPLDGNMTAWGDWAVRTLTEQPTTTVPEPGTYALLATGLAVLFFARRRINS